MTERFARMRKLNARLDSTDAVRRSNRHLNRTYFAPVLTALLGIMLFVYSRSTIAAAKEHAARTREADGGSINWRKENARRHGALQKQEEQSLLQYMWNGLSKADSHNVKPAPEQDSKQQQDYRNPLEERLRQSRSKGASRSDN